MAKFGLAMAALCLAAGCAASASAQQVPATASSVSTVPTVQSVPPGNAQALPSTAAPAASGATSTDDTAADPSNAGGNVAELQRMIRGSDLVELRTSYNGSYGASLLFYPREITYYVALFQQKNFWRVIKTTDADRADMVYRDFALQTRKLADVEIRRTQLEAQKAFTERMIARTQDHVSRLQADLAVAQTRQEAVTEHQRAAQQQAAELESQRRAAQSELNALQARIADLQQQADAGITVPSKRRR
ncbi:MAG: DUF2968 domain-containing protein [Janthinobacterium lividum]